MTSTSAPSHPPSFHRPLRPTAILATAQADRPVIQDFRPLADSLDWELGQLYLKERGSKAFLSDPEPVPFTVNNDGNLSSRCAEVFFANVAEADSAGTLEPDIFVLELGIGVGLFARLFLDAFRDLCDRAGKDYYDRLTYVAADRSETMLRDAARHGTFANHPGRYLLRLADALRPELALSREPLLADQGPTPFRAVFLNYLLDCLPAAVLRFEGDSAQQLCVRTCLARSASPTDLAPYRLDDLPHLAELDGRHDRRALLQIYPLLASEYAFRPADLTGLPYADFAASQARAHGNGSVVHSHGAIQCLERLLALVRDGGLIFVNDYGQTDGPSADGFQHQHFSDATFVGVNFPLLEAFFSRLPDLAWLAPAEETASVHARLLGNVGPATAAAFRDRFGKSTLEASEQPAQLARECRQHARLETALSAYSEALERQPYNWALMGEVAHFLTFALQRPAAGLEMARSALALNPACSAELWNMLGDSLFALGRHDDSRAAYERALQVNADDVQARYNLAFVHAQAGDLALALRRIAEGLALDKLGRYREGLLEKQREVLARLEQQQQQHAQRMVNRVSPPRPTPTAIPA